jgi:arylsulfatase A-like enzyme/regulation of enolase protein 1 (concanavalin A-like superfamily)
MTNEDIDDVEGKAGGDRLSDITVDRRRFMETLGIGAAGLSGLGGTAGAQSSDEVIELEAVTVDDGEGDPEHVWKAAVLSIAESVADESAPLEQIDLDEVQQATNWWATGAEVPDTGGETIELGAVQDLINRWATGDTDGIDSINPTLSLTAGEEYTVEWTNVDGGEHNFVVADADGNELESSSTFGDQGATQTFTFTATEGMTEYYCGTHPDSQRGTIEVDGGSVERPNVVLIMADDMGYGDTSVPPFTSGEPTPTPNLEAMASNGATFTSHYNGAPVCTPSRAALLTGCYPARAGMDAHDVYFPGASNGLHPDEVTIPEVLQGQGYATGMVGKWHLGDADPFLPPNQGFDTYYGVPYSNDMSPFPLLEGVETIRDEAPNSQLTQLYTEQATQFIADHQDEPFFLYLPHTMAHVPLGVSDDFDGATDHGTYADVIHELDWSVGQILDQLESLGIEEETLVVFTTDDGPWLSYGDDAGTGGPLRGGKMSTWEGGARAPTIMHMPGTIPAGASCDEMTSHIDFLPTAASLAGADLPDATTDGEDLTEVLENPESASSPHDYLMYYGDGLEAIRNAEGWKYHFGSGNLYDLEADIDESNDVSGQNPGIADELQQQGNSFDDDLQVNARPEGSLSNIAYLSVGSSGSNGETTVTFTNNRDVTVTDVSVTASSPDDGVTVEPSSTSLGSVDPGSSVTVQVQLTSSGDSTTGESFVLAEATYTADGVTRDTEAGEHVTFVNLDPVPSQYSTFNNGSQNPVFGSKDGSLIIEGTGGVYGENDAYSTIYLDDGLPSSGTVVAKVTDVDQAMEFSTGDLVVRNDITKPGESPGYVNVSVNQVNAQIKIDENGDGNIQQTELQDFSGNGLPKWLRVQRSGTNYTASYSSDGSNWTQIAAFTLEGATDVQDVGVAVTSGTEENARVEFGEFQVSDASDIGPLPEKYSTFNNGSSDPQYGALGDTLVVEGTGKAAGDADEYTTVFLDDGLLDGATAVAKIDSVELVSQYSTGGFIVRNDATQPGSSQGYAMVSVNENGGEVKFDENANGFLDEPGSTFEVNGLPAWLKLERSGTSYTASYSADGSSWTEASTFDLENASALQDIGIAVTAPAEENTRVEFSEFEVLEPLPAEYSTFNNGSSSPEYGVSDGTLFVEGTGKAANGTDEYTTIYLDDAFSDGSTATAKVTDVEMVTDFSTADLVVRNDLTKPAESPGYASITVNDDIQESKVDADGNGIFESSEITENTSPGLPVWLRWERSGTTVTASYSTDGSTWSEITTVDLPSPTVAQDVGIAVTGPEGNQRVEIGEVTVDNGTN